MQAWTWKIFFWLGICLLDMVSALAFWLTQWWSYYSQTPGCVLHSLLQVKARKFWRKVEFSWSCWEPLDALTEL